MLRSGAHWQDLPERYGTCKTGHNRFSCRAATVVWEKVSDDLIKNRDNHYLMLDSTLVRAHQQGTAGRGSGRKKGGRGPAVGRSRALLTTKARMACDRLGRPVRFRIAAGQGHDTLAVPAPLKGHRPAAILADRAYDANSLRRHLDQIGAEAVIPSTRSRKAPIPHDAMV